MISSQAGLFDSPTPSPIERNAAPHRTKVAGVGGCASDFYYSHDKAKTDPLISTVDVEPDQHHTPEGGLVYSSISHRTRQRHYEEAYRVTHFEVHKKSVKLHRTKKCFDQKPSPVKRKAIELFTGKSQRGLRHCAINADPELCSMFVATYPAKFPMDGKEAKRHLDNFLKRIRRHYPAVKYLWVLEFQYRGAPHFHIFFTVEYGEEFHHFLAEAWTDIVADDESREAVLRVHKSKKQFISWDMGNGQYVCKYLDKERQKDVPEQYRNVGRFWGASRGLVPKPSYIVAQEMTLALSLKTPEASKQVVRWLTKWHEKYTGGKSKSRRTITNYAIPTGAPVLKQILRYFRDMETPKVPPKPKPVPDSPF